MCSYWVLWTGQALSLFGSQAVQFALIWWLTRQTGSATLLALATFLGLLPQIVLGPFIGAVVDRTSRKRVMLLADGAVALASALLAAAFLGGKAQVGLVLALLFVRAVAGAFHAPAMLAATSLMVPPRHLVRIQGLNQSLQGGLLIVSAPLGALLFAALPMAGVMAVDVLTALCALGPLLFVDVPEPGGRPDARPADAAPRSLWREIAAGFRYLGDRPGHLALLGMAAAINLCMVPAFSLLPLLVAESGQGAMQLAWMTSTFGVGTIAGGIVLGAWGGFERRILTTLGGLIGLGLSIIALGAVPASIFAGVLAAIFAVGFMVPLTNGPIQALLQATVAPEFQGRIFTLYGTLAAVATPAGLAAAVPLADLAGVRFWYALAGAVCSLLGAAGYFIPSVVNLDRRPTPTA